MKKYISIFILIIFSISNSSQAQDLLSLLNDQVNAFNQQDVDKLVENVSEDMKYFYITSDA